MSAKVGSSKKDHGRVRMLNGKKVVPVLYNGHHVGHGKYFAGAVDDVLVLDENGVPRQFREIGELV